MNDCYEIYLSDVSFYTCSMVVRPAQSVPIKNQR